MESHQNILMKLTYDHESREKLLKVVREFGPMVKVFDLWHTTNASKVYRLFQNTINGSVQNSWDNIVGGENMIQGDTLLDRLLGTDAYKIS